jgi:tetratricopeptide (TPR) repeat protein
VTALLLAVALLTTDPCAPPPPAGAPDPAAAEAYRKVGDAERAAGALETAAVAYREALARDPADAAARAALGALCRGQREESPFRRGMRLLDAGDRRGAVEAFREARAAGPDTSASLMEGVALYELGDDAEAGRRFAEAREDAAHRQAADLYLGFIALRAGEGAEAARRFEAAATSPDLAPLAAGLLPLARRTGKLLLAAAADGLWDSNAQLAPTGTPLGTSSDGAANLSASALYRPLGESGPYLSASGFFHKQIRFEELDQAGLAGSAGWQLGRGSRALLAEYGYEERTLNGAQFLGAHRLLAAGWLPAGHLTLAASYLVRFESYQGTLYQPFSGTLQRAEVSAAAPLGPAARVLFAYGLARELSFVEHGPRAELRLALAPRLRLDLHAALAWRPYDVFDAQLGVARSDTTLDGAARLEWDLAERVVLRAGVEGRRNWSSAAALDYLRVVPTVGIGFVTGLL